MYTVAMAAYASKAKMMCENLGRETSLTSLSPYCACSKEFTNGDIYQGLNHEVSLCPQDCHVSIDIDRVFMFYSFQHGVDNDEDCGATNTSTEIKHTRE